MKYAILFLLLAVSSLASQTSYYLSSIIYETTIGTSELTRCKIIRKSNSSFSIIKPGDRKLFKGGDRFYSSKGQSHWDKEIFLQGTM